MMPQVEVKNRLMSCIIYVVYHAKFRSYCVDQSDEK